MYCMFVCIWTWIQIDSINFRWGCSSVVERMLCMYEAPGSIPGISMGYFGVIMSVNAFSTKPTWKCLLTLDGIKMRQPGIEPGSTAWKAAMLTTIPLTLYSILKWQPNQYFLFWRKEDNWIKLRKQLFPSGVEPETFCVLDRSDSHYTTDNQINIFLFCRKEEKILQAGLNQSDESIEQ